MALAKCTKIWSSFALGVCLILTTFQLDCNSLSYSDTEIENYRIRVVRMFEHAYNGYLKHAYPYDELRPLTCDGHDTWGNYSLTLIDALDTLAVIGNFSEFRRVAKLLEEILDFERDINVSVFETNIRVLGGLLSAHLLSYKAEVNVETGWPCQGPLLRLAEKVARKLLPAFNTTTGMPYGTVNLLRGVPVGETSVTCTAGVGTFIVEFGTLSRLTGDPVFEQVALRAINSLHATRSAIGLIGNHIDVMTGKWTAQDAGIGAGVDSYFEYLVKGGVMFDYPRLIDMFHEYKASLEMYAKRDDWFLWAQMQKGSITQPVFQSLEAYWPGVLSLIGETEDAMKTYLNYHHVWRQFGFMPEFYNIPQADTQTGRESYPLRPEFIESTMYLYRATRDPYLMSAAVDVLESIEHSARTDCGYATIKNVRDHMLENRMESFFLSETVKYLYLMFDPHNFIHSTGSQGTLISLPDRECIIDAGGYIFNTEAHPMDPAAVHCCSAERQKQDEELDLFNSNLDLLAIVLEDENESFDIMKGKRRHRHDKVFAAENEASKCAADVEATVSDTDAIIANMAATTNYDTASSNDGNSDAADIKAYHNNIATSIATDTTSNSDSATTYTTSNSDANTIDAIATDSISSITETADTDASITSATTTIDATVTDTSTTVSSITDTMNTDSSIIDTTTTTTTTTTTPETVANTIESHTDTLVKFLSGTLESMRKLQLRATQEETNDANEKTADLTTEMESKDADATTADATNVADTKTTTKLELAADATWQSLTNWNELTSGSNRTFRHLCPAQPFHARFAQLGEVFLDRKIKTGSV